MGFHPVKGDRRTSLELGQRRSRLLPRRTLPADRTLSFFSKILEKVVERLVLSSTNGIFQGVKDYRIARMAGFPLSAGSDMGRRRSELCHLFRECDRQSNCFFMKASNRNSREKGFSSQRKRDSSGTPTFRRFFLGKLRLFDSGPYEPEKGFRFNPHKALIDPYTRAIAGTIKWNDTLFGYTIGDEKEDLSLDERDSGPFIPKSIVIETEYDWEGDKLLRIPWNETIIYEMHVKGFTRAHPEVNKEKQGTYEGLASPKVIRYLKDLGVTAVELLPIHHHVDNKFLVDVGLSNYWGYNTIGYFAPDTSLLEFGKHGRTGSRVQEHGEESPQGRN